MEEDNPASLKTLQEIRHLMERSSRFISLSGLSGVFAGIYALVGAYVAYRKLGLEGLGFYGGERTPYGEVDKYLYIDALMVMVLAIGTGILLTTRKARKDGNSIFDKTARKLVINFCIPLIAGGIFCLGLIFHGGIIYIAPSMLVFYGLALLHGSSFTRSDIRNLAIAEIVLGLISLFVIEYGLLFWAIGFGVMHIAYGSYMYFKYER